MKNKKFDLVVLFFIFFLLFTKVYSEDQFNFEVKEIEIIEKGNKFLGKNGGVVTSDNGIIINAKNFIYDKKLNILYATGDVEINDTINEYILFTDKVTYEKNKDLFSTDGKSKIINSKDKILITSKSLNYDRDEQIIFADQDVVVRDKIRNYKLNSNFLKYYKKDGKIFTKGNSKLLNLNDKTEISAEIFEYDIIRNIIVARKDVKFENDIKKYQILSDEIKYLKNQERIFSKGKTSAKINSKYNLNSRDVTFLKNKLEIYSNSKTILKDNSNLYNLNRFHYYIEKEELKGEEILINLNYKQPKNDNLYFSSGVINLKNKNYIAKDPLINFHKSIFGNSDNDPRLKGVSTKKKGAITVVNKGIYTTCKKKDGCPPWQIQANMIEHDNQKKQLLYKDAVVKLYDVPVFYFPKFFHPDPTVDRQTGFLKPELNNSNTVGSSITLPYFKVITDNKDFTFTPTVFDTNTLSFQNEYRQLNKNSNIEANFGYIKNYNSKTINKRKNLSHLFINYGLDLNLENFQSSDFSISLEKVSNDTYLKIFDQYITQSKLRPDDFNNLNSKIELYLDHEDYNFSAGMEMYENLQLKKSDRYQYTLPYYNFSKTLDQNFYNGTLFFKSTGNNNLKETNNLLSNVINDLIWKSPNFINKYGINNSFEVSFKNLNSLGKNNSKYKSSPQIELVSMFNFDTSYPLVKINKNSKNSLVPKLNFKFNPSDMKNYSASNNKVDINNIFLSNRLGLSDTFESGKSVTLGIDFQKETKNDLDEINNYFEFKLATVLRDKEENLIPKKSSIHRKNSNIFGSITNKFSENIDLNYNFSIDNDYTSFEYNDFSANYSYKNFNTSLSFIEENGEIGDSNVLENSIRYNFNENNFISFNTRRNRKIDLTEYYNLVYEYQNDCLTAGIKFKKSYYEDRDLRPSEDLLFTITLFPLTTYEYEADSF